jgi:hypothetical protein
MRDLSQRIQRLFMAAEGMFVLGAIGIELLGSRHSSLQGGDNFLYVMP